MLVYASCVAIKGQGVLLMGPSGAGKSDVALRLIDQGASLVSDDQTILQNNQGQLIASPPKTIAGIIEVRNVGLMQLSFEPCVPIALCVDLVVKQSYLDRLPEPSFYSFLDCSVRGLKLAAYEASIVAKIRLVLQGTFANA